MRAIYYEVRYHVFSEDLVYVVYIQSASWPRTLETLAVSVESESANLGPSP